MAFRPPLRAPYDLMEPEGGDGEPVLAKMGGRKEDTRLLLLCCSLSTANCFLLLCASCFI
jgi:hypothetical protein